MRDDLTKSIRELLVIRNRFEDRTDQNAAERMKCYHISNTLTDLMTFLDRCKKEL